MVAAIVALMIVASCLVLKGDETTYTVPSGSMLPTYEQGDEITIDEDETDPEVEDIIVFHPPLGAQNERCGDEGVGPPPGEVCTDTASEAEDELFVKRVVAGPGDTLQIVDGHAIVNGEPQDDDDYTEPCGGGSRCNFPSEVVIPDGHYFTLGDNRGSSDDSRFWGPVPQESIVGTVQG